MGFVDIEAQLIVWIVGTVIAAAIIAAAVWAARKPGRWLWRTVVVQPLAGWFRRELGEEVDLKIGPVVAQVEHIAEAIRPTNGDRRSISDRLDTVKATGIKTEGRVGKLEKHLADRFAVTDEIAAEVSAIHKSQTKNRPNGGLGA